MYHPMLSWRGPKERILSIFILHEQEGTGMHVTR
jgi:hypothetical protein